MDEIKPDLVDELLKGYEKVGRHHWRKWVLKRVTKALMERALKAELTHHLGYEKQTRLARALDAGFVAAVLEASRGRAAN